MMQLLDADALFQSVLVRVVYSGFYVQLPDSKCGFSVPKTSPAQALKQGALAVAVVAWAGWDKLKL